MENWSITIASDLKNDFDGAKTLIYSIKKFTKIEKINLILPMKKSEKHKEMIELCKNLEFKVTVFRPNIKKLLKNTSLKSDMEELKHIPLFVYSKMLVPKIVKYKKTIYLDTDTLFVRDFNLDFLPKTNKKIFVVNNGEHAPEYWFSQYGKKIFRNEKETAKKAFNAGVIFFNSERERSFNRMTKKIINSIKNNDFSYLDQAHLNYVYKDKVHYLDLKYNFPVHNQFKEIVAKEKEPIILHFASNQKPWKNYKLRGFNSEAEKYFEKWREINQELNQVLISLDEKKKKMTR